MSCETQNVIYLLQCGGCGEEYIGDTLRHRMTLHRQHIRHSNVRKLFVSEHIANYATGLDINFRLFPLSKLKTDNATSRKIKESYFIELFKPKLNRTF